PNTMGGMNGSWTRTCVATAPPRYVVVRIAPSTAVRGMQYKTTTAISTMPMGTRVCRGYPNLPVNTSITPRFPVSLTTPLNNMPSTGRADRIRPAHSQERRSTAWTVGNAFETSVMDSPSQGIPPGDPHLAYRCPRTVPVAIRFLPLALAPRERERGDGKSRRAHPLSRRRRSHAFVCDARWCPCLPVGRLRQCSSAHPAATAPGATRPRSGAGSSSARSAARSPARGRRSQHLLRLRQLDALGRFAIEAAVVLRLGPEPFGSPHPHRGQLRRARHRRVQPCA